MYLSESTLIEMKISASLVSITLSQAFPVVVFGQDAVIAAIIEKPCEKMVWLQSLAEHLSVFLGG